MSMSWQTPPYVKKIQQHHRELEEFLRFIQQGNIRSYLEIGCKYGGLLWTVASVMPPKSRLVAVDLPHGAWGRSDSEFPLQECCKELGRRGHDVTLFIGDSTSPPLVEKVRALAPFDCVFIDANHTEKYVRTDFTNYGRLAKFCCFHDISWNNPTPPNRLAIEVPKVWAELKQTFHDTAKFREIKHDSGHNGIGILKWR